MNRPFDIRNSWLDDEGKPLVGRVKFCKLRTTEPETVYNYWGFVIDNPVYTNTIGQTQYQVFLQDKTSYTVYFDKYIGNGIMESDDEQTNWQTVYSCDDIWNVYGVEVDSKGYQMVKTIDDLRNTDPNTVDNGVIELGGYYELGDKPTVRYVWDDNPNLPADNGGDIIKYNNLATGRWVLVNDFNSVTGIDVRHFGLFGEPTMNTSSSTNLQLAVAKSYANSVNLPLYFPSIDGLTWYKLDGESVKAIFAPETRVFNTSTSRTYIRVMSDSDNLDVYSNDSANGPVTISGETVRTSWGYNSTNVIFNPTYKLIIDSIMNTTNKTFSNIIVEMDVVTDGLELNNCQIVCYKKIGTGCTFHNCELKESYFASTMVGNTVYDDDIIELKNFPTTSKWLQLVTQNSNIVLDFEGRTLDGTCVIGWTGTCVYKNAVFDGFVINQDTIHFENCRGVATLTDDSITDMVMQSSDISFTCNDGQHIENVVLSSSIVSCGRDVTIGSIVCNGSTINDSTFTYNITSTSFIDSILNVAITASLFNAIGCTINQAINCNTPAVKKCTIVAPINQNIITSVGTFDISGNTFLTGGSHLITATLQNTVLNGKWNNNYSECSYHFIGIDRTNIDFNEAHHTYEYEGNKGPHVLQRLSAEWEDTIIIDQNLAYTNPKVCSVVGLMIDEEHTRIECGVTHSGSMFQVALGGTNPDVYLTEFQMFSVGTVNVGVLSLETVPPQHLTASMCAAMADSAPQDILTEARIIPLDEWERAWSSTRAGVARGIYFMQDYTWRICQTGYLFGFRGRVLMAETHFELPVKYRLKR